MPSKYTLKEMATIQTEFEHKFAGLPGVTGIGLGKSRSGEYELKVYVDSIQSSRRLPQRFKEAPVSVEVTGKISAY